MSQLLAALALLAPLSGMSQRAAHTRPETVCRATLEGSDLVTTFQHPSGYRVEGIWTLLAVRRRDFGPDPAATVTELLLDHVVEWADGQRVAVPVTLSVTREALAADQLEALSLTIGAWCNTVERALEEGVHFSRLRERAWRWI